MWALEDGRREEHFCKLKYPDLGSPVYVERERERERRCDLSNIVYTARAVQCAGQWRGESGQAGGTCHTSHGGEERRTSHQ